MKKALTVYQPHASLIALNFKPIETRCWATKYRGPLAVHAGLKRPPVYWHHNVNDGLPPEYDLIPMARYWEWTEHPDDFMSGGAYRWCGPLGAVVATCTLVDCVPVDRLVWWLDDWSPDDAVWWRCPPLDMNGCGAFHIRADQRPFGDFSPGRFAWLLADIEALPEPIPVKGKQGLWNWPEGDSLAAQARP